MSTIFLRWPDEPSYQSAIAPFLDSEGGITIPNWDVIGLIYTGGEYESEGNITTPPELVPGYHVNALEIPAELEQYVIARPNLPYRIFAGGEQ